MNRRSFVWGLGTLFLSRGLLGCGSSGGRPTLRVQLLKGSIPAVILGKFRERLQQAEIGNVALDFVPQPRVHDLFELLQAWKRRGGAPPPASQPPIAIPFVTQTPTPKADLVTLGDYWLEKAIQQQLIQPLDPTQWTQWKSLSPRWQSLVMRDRQGKPDANGQVWAAPYRWGYTLIVYRKDLFEQQGLALPTDWADLWLQDLQGKISLLDNPREIIGLTLKKLGYSYNLADIQQVSKLQQELTALNRQTKFYGSTNYLQPLLLGQTWLAVGWSTDILQAMKRNYKLGTIVPQSGTALWADLWVRPASISPAPSSPLLHQWIDFCWQDKIAEQLSLQSQGISPLFLDPTQKRSSTLEKIPGLAMGDQTLGKSEFLLPVTKATLMQYQQLWHAMRQVVA